MGGGRHIGAPSDVATLAKIKDEAEYFGLDSLVLQVKACRPGAAALEVASFSDLAHLDFPASFLQRVGFQASKLKDRGIVAADLLVVGWSITLLRDLGFTVDDLKEAGINEETIASVCPRKTL